MDNGQWTIVVFASQMDLNIFIIYQKYVILSNPEHSEANVNRCLPVASKHLKMSKGSRKTYAPNICIATMLVRRFIDKLEMTPL